MKCKQTTTNFLLPSFARTSWMRKGSIICSKANSIQVLVQVNLRSNVSSSFYVVELILYLASNIFSCPLLKYFLPQSSYTLYLLENQLKLQWLVAVQRLYYWRSLYIRGTVRKVLNISQLLRVFSCSNLMNMSSFFNFQWHGIRELELL